MVQASEANARHKAEERSAARIALSNDDSALVT